MTATVNPTSKSRFRSKTYLGLMLIVLSVVANHLPPEWVQAVVDHIKADNSLLAAGIGLVLYGREKAELPLRWPWSREE